MPSSSSNSSLQTSVQPLLEPPPDDELLDDDELLEEEELEELLLLLLLDELPLDEELDEPPDEPPPPPPEPPPHAPTANAHNNTNIHDRALRAACFIAVTTVSSNSNRDMPDTALTYFWKTAFLLVLAKKQKRRIKTLLLLLHFSCALPKYWHPNLHATR